MSTSRSRTSTSSGIRSLGLASMVSIQRVSGGRMKLELSKGEEIARTLELVAIVADPLLNRVSGKLRDAEKIMQPK